MGLGHLLFILYQLISIHLLSPIVTLRKTTQASYKEIWKILMRVVPQVNVSVDTTYFPENAKCEDSVSLGTKGISYP